MERRGKWIWRDRGRGYAGGNPRGAVSTKDDANLFVQFRRTFSLEAVPTNAACRISADGRYRLFVNGMYVGRGPARCEPLFQYYDEYDIAPLLRPGENVVAVLAHSYGRDMSWYELPRAHWALTFGCGGVWFECDGVPAIDSDASWRYEVAEAWEKETPPGSVGFVEEYDARKAIARWMEPAFDDGGWGEAFLLEAPGTGGIAPATVPFPHMVARDIPHLFEEHRDAARIVSISEILSGDADIPADDMLSLAEAAPGALQRCSVENRDGLLNGTEAFVNTVPGRAVSTVIDFGRDVTGFPRLDVDGPAGATVDVSYAERLRPDGRVPVQRPNPITSQNVHRYILRDGPQTWEKFDRAGFRYLQLTVSGAPDKPDAPVAIRRANINFTSYPVGSRGSFECSDGVLNDVWRAGAYTMQLCMQDGFEDCPSREQRQWVGDAYVESLVNYACFGDGRLTAKLIRQVTQSQRRDGMTMMATPSDASARWPVYIVDYCLSWIMATHAYAEHTGDDAILEDVFPHIVEATAWFERHIGRDGLLVDPPGWIFIDWAEVDKRGACTALNALLVLGLRAAADIAESEGVRSQPARWRELSERISGALNEKLWDNDRGVYVDALVDGVQSRRVSQQANGVMIAAGIAPRDRWNRMLDYIMDDDRIAATSTSLAQGPVVNVDEGRQVVLAQPFFSHFVHRALAAAGRHEAIVQNIRKRWSPMLEDGDGTLWEHWHGEESRCHAWSATPVYDLSTELLGVMPLAPGYRRFRVEPHPSGLDWARGVWPSAVGDIRLEWKRESGTFALTIEVPGEAEAEVVLPDGATHRAAPGVHSFSCGFP